MKLNEDDLIMGVKDNKPAIIKMEKFLDVSHFKVVIKAGSLQWGDGWPPDYFTLHGKTTIVISSNRSNPIPDTFIYAPATHSGDAYQSKEIQQDAKEVVLPTKVPIFYKPGDFIMIWNGEDFADIYDADNVGSLTVDVYGYGKDILASYCCFSFHVDPKAGIKRCVEIKYNFLISFIWQSRYFIDYIIKNFSLLSGRRSQLGFFLQCPLNVF